MGRGPVTQRKIDMILKMAAEGLPQKVIREKAHVGSQTLTAVLGGRKKTRELSEPEKLIKEWDALTIHALKRRVLPSNMWIYEVFPGNCRGVILADTKHEGERRVRQMYHEWGDKNISIELYKVGRGMSIYYPDILEVYYEE